MDAREASFVATTDAAQRTAGVIAARHRGDLDGANALLVGFDGDTELAAGALLLADLAVALLAHAEHRAVDEVAADLSLRLAELAPRVGRAG